MRFTERLTASLTLATLCACSGAAPSGFTNEDGGSGASSGGGGRAASDDGGPNGVGNLGGGGSSSSGGGAGVTAEAGTTTTIYAHTDSELYTMNPQSKAVTLVGSFASASGSGSLTITDLAVNAAGDVYVNSETAVYKAALPAGGSGAIALTPVATIAAQKNQSFYALAFTPADALGPGTGEVLIGGDGSGELWSISTVTGATKDLGSFGIDPNDASSTLALSGDVVFYLDAGGKPTGLATIRSCTTSSKGSISCGGSSDYLAGIDMTALGTAYTSGNPAASLNAGIYGSPSPSQTGPGTGFGDVFGLGAWGGSVYGFTRGSSSGSPASLISIATSGAAAGVGTLVPEKVTVSNGWSGAGVTTTVTVSVAAPPAPPPK